ncbi:MAG TPA: multidrug transporter [Prevotellaceae bacterium]|mgnify:FL=1|nr:multidrug transporter [Prevotellaceae bacterium]
MKAYKILAITLATALLGSCGVYKSYERPASISADGIYGDAQSGDSTGLGDIEWRQVFTDPTLQALIEKTLAQNTNMKQTDLRIQEMQNNLKASRLAFAPSFAFAPSGTISGIVDPYNRSEYKDVMGNGASKTYSFPLTMSWQIDCFASLRNAKKKAEVALENQKWVRQSVKASLIANVANLYYSLAMLDEQLRIAKETSETWKKNVEMTKMLFEAGQANQASVASTEANYWSISANVLDLENNIKQVENALSTLCGERPSHIERGTLATFRTPDVCTTGLPVGLLSRRPDVKQAELALASAFYNKNIAKAAFYPNLNISASGQYANSLGTMVVNPGGIIMSAVASLTQPIFQNGKLRAAYRNSKAELEIATLGFQQTLLDAGSEVNNAMSAIHTAQAKKTHLAKQVQSMQDAVDATQKLWDLTSINYLQILTAQSNLLSAQLTQVANDYSIISNTINLYQALGGGTDLQK